MRAIIVLFFFMPFFAFTQKYDQIWIGGIRSYKQFPKDCPWCTRVMTFTETGIHYQYVKNYIEMRGTTPITISDKEGNLLFYTNGNTIASYDHSIMENGRRLNDGSPFSGYNIYGDSIGDWAYPSFCYMVFPDPDDKHIFYMFHTYLLFAPLTDSVPDGYQVYSDKLQITKIDMSAKNGLGKVVYKNKPLLEEISSYHFNAVQHGNGRDWWLFMRNIQGDQYMSLRIEKDSLKDIVYSEAPVVQPFPFKYTDSVFIAASVPFISPNGSILVDNFGRQGYLRRFQLDRCTGDIKFVDTLFFGVAKYDPKDFGQPNNPVFYGGREVGFSQDNRFMYIGGVDGFYQYELDAPDLFASGVQLTGPPIWMEDLTQSPSYGSVFIPSMAHGPDGKIYALFRANHHVINHPNEKGLAADMCLAYEQPPSCLGVPHHLFSPHYPNYRLGPLKGSDCDTIISAVTPVPTEGYGLRIWPNPASGLVYMDITLPEYYSGVARVEVYDLLGRMVHTHVMPQYAYMHSMDTQSLPGGLYVVILYHDHRPVKVEKLVVN